MQLNPYLTFDGQCEAAFRFYEQALGGTIVAIMTCGESPMAEQTPAELRGQIMHARLIVGDTVLMGSDAPGERYEKMKGFSVALGVDEPAEAERVFNALAAGGTVTMPIQETFWAHRFGTPWMINCEKPM